jgi:flagellar hook-associated protein 1 FlgK
MTNVIWGGSAIGQAVAGLTLAEHRMKRLSADMLAMNTPGFVRTSEDVSIEYVSGNPYGIREGNATEITDSVEENNLRSIAASARGAEAAWNYIQQVANAFGQMGPNSAIASSGNKIFRAIEAAHTNGVNSLGNRAAIADAIKNHLDGISAIATSIQNVRGSAENDRANKINEINSLLQQIADINAQISGVAGNSASQTGFLRQRRVLLDKLGEYIALQPPRTEGDFILQTASGRTIVHNENAAKFLYTPHAAVTASTVFNPIYLQTIATDPTAVGAAGGQEALAIDVTNEFNSPSGIGSLSALTTFLQGSSASFLSFLDSYAAGFRDSMNKVHNLGSAINPRPTLTGSAGFIGGDTLTGAQPIQAQGMLRVAIVNNASKNATYSLDLNLSTAGVTDVTSLVGAINGSGLNAYLVASINPATNSLQLALNPTYAGSDGIALGAVAGQPAPLVGITGNPNQYGFSEFFHLNDLISAPANFYRDGTCVGLAQQLSLNPLIANDTSAAALSLVQLRNDATLGTTSQAVASDPSVGRSLMDLFNRSQTNFPATGPNAAYSGTFENFASTILSSISAQAQVKKNEAEAQKEAYKQQSLIFSQTYGLNESEVATLSLQISRSQDLYFSFINNYFRMMKHVAEMGR